MEEEEEDEEEQGEEQEEEEEEQEEQEEKEKEKDRKKQKEEEKKKKKRRRNRQRGRCLRGCSQCYIQPCLSVACLSQSLDYFFVHLSIPVDIRPWVGPRIDISSLRETSPKPRKHARSQQFYHIPSRISRDGRSRSRSVLNGGAGPGQPGEEVLAHKPGIECRDQGLVNCLS